MWKAERPQEVVLRLVPGGEARPTLDEIYRRYCRYVAAVILRLGGRPSEVDDLVQDVFVEAASGIGRLREPEAIKGWLATIAVRTVRRRLRMRRAWRFLGLQRDEGEIVLVDPRVSPADRALLRAVYEILDEMPIDDRIAFTLHVIEGETLPVVAKLCGCALATAKRRVARGQKMIEQRMSDG
ncbi:MAG TPA: sigma-70 family RNA polymerase sigma factor [Polyangia bacterium]|nr:sigma-70 family RNA polymerase sigma factor [Polyangia bacterium]